MRLQNIDKVTRNGMFLFRRALHDFELGGKLIQKDSKVDASRFSLAGRSDALF